MTVLAPSPMSSDSRRRAVVLGICCLSVFVTGVDLTIVNVALPSIGRAFGASVSGLQWAIDAYTLVIACLLMLSGSLADRFGRRRVFLIGQVTFSIGSLLCSVSGSLGALVAFRGLQAVGGALLNPVAMAIIASTFTEPAERARAVDVWGSVVGVSLAAGPVLGGVLVSAIGWRSIFWLNVRVGALAVALTMRFVPESRAERPRRVDPVGQVLVILILGPATGAVIEGPRQGWSSTLIIALFAVAIVSAAALVLVEPRRREPLIDVRFFRSAPFSGAALIAVVALTANAGFLFLNTLYLQDARGYTPLHAGLMTIPFAGAVAVCSNISGKIIARRGPRLALGLDRQSISDALPVILAARTGVPTAPVRDVLGSTDVALAYGGQARETRAARSSPGPSAPYSRLRSAPSRAATKASATAAGASRISTAPCSAKASASARRRAWAGARPGCAMVWPSSVLVVATCAS